MLHFLLQSNHTLSLVTGHASFPPSREPNSLFSYRARFISSFKGIILSLWLPGMLHFLLQGNHTLSFVTGHASFPPSRESYSLFGYRACYISSVKGIILSLLLPGTLIFLVQRNHTLSFVTGHTPFSSFKGIILSLLLPGTLHFLRQGNHTLSFVTEHALFPPSRESYSLFCYRGTLHFLRHGN